MFIKGILNIEEILAVFLLFSFFVLYRFGKIQNSGLNLTAHLFKVMERSKNECEF